MMDRRPLFFEKQYFSKYFLILLGVLLFIILYRLYNQMMYAIPFGKNPMSNRRLIVNVVLYFLIFLVLSFSNLKTSIDADGIGIVFFPFFIKRFYKWEQIKEVEVREYRPLDYWGWGIRINASTTTYTTRGKHAILLKLWNNKKILIGTQKPEEVCRIVGLF